MADPAAPRAPVSGTVDYQRGLLRTIDESGEDYLYPEALFAPIEFPEAVGKEYSAAG